MNMQDYLNLLHQMAQENERSQRSQQSANRDQQHYSPKPDLTTDEEE